MLKVPAYVKVYEAIKRRIAEGEYSIGSMLPPEPALEEIFGVSRTTVRKAVEYLAREGFVFVKQGRGTEVIDFNTRQNLNTVTSTSETLERKGYKVLPKLMQIDSVPAQGKLASEMAVPEGTMLVRVHRIQTADDKPIAIMKNYLKPEMVPFIDKYCNKFTRLYDFMEEQYGIVIDSAIDRITAKNATREEAQMLSIPAGTALIYLSRTCYQSGITVCVDHVRIIGDFYEFEVMMSGRYKKPIG